MKTLYNLIYMVLISSITAHAQFGSSCLPEGISFVEQSQVDSFHVNYPGCTNIEGDVFINGYVYNLNGLVGLETIGGSLEINSVPFPDLTGLDSLNSIGGNLGFYSTELTDMTGLGSLEKVGGDLTIGCFTHTGLDCNNYKLENLSGFQKLDSIGGTLTVQSCHSLTNIDALSGLTHVGAIYIKANPLLNSVTGLTNINAENLTSLTIAANPSLSSCEVESLCSFLENPPGAINIYQNGPGCNNPVEIADGCGVVLSCLPYGNYWFHSQADINNFPQNFPDCHEIGGSIFILGPDIVNLSPFNEITNVGGNLFIGSNDEGYNPVLQSLSGLESLESIGGTLHINDNPMLQNLSGLQNLSSIGNYLEILSNDGLSDLSGLEELTSIGSGISIQANDGMINLSALGNVTNAGSNIWINLNDSLTSLSGLDNISTGSITLLKIYFNDMLSDCDVASICEYLTAPNGEIDIASNAPGCNSQEEVEAACFQDVPEVVSRQSSVISYPNPTHGIVDFQFTVYNLQSVSLKIYNVQGQQVAELLDKELSVGDFLVRWDASALPAGIYYYRLTTDDYRLTTDDYRLTTGKLVKY